MSDVEAAGGWPDLTRRAPGVSRRAVLRAAAAAGVVGAGGPSLAACGTGGAAKTEAEQAAPDRSDQDKRVVFSNWPLYVDVDEKNPAERPTLAAFTARTGVRVTYTEDINDNDEFFGKIRPDLAAGNDLKRDLITLTDWMCARLIRLNWVQELDHGNIGNLKNLQPALRGVSWDAGRTRSVPWQSGVTGIAYDEKLTRPVRTVDELLSRPDLRGRVTVLKEMRDTVGLILAQRGRSPARFTDADYDAALGVLDDAVRAKQIRRFTGNDYTQDLAAGNVAACLAWSGDVVQLQADNPGIRFVVPEAGGLLFSDNLMVPNKAAHKKNAELLIDHYYDPKVAAQLAASVNYICPVVGAQEEMRRVDPELAANPLVFPDDATLARLTVFRGLDEKTERRYNDAFQKVSGA